MDRQKLRREILATLEFYATMQNWRSPPVAKPKYPRGPSAVEEDRGSKARLVLDQIRKLKTT